MVCRMRCVGVHLARAARPGRPDGPDGRPREICGQTGAVVYGAIGDVEIYISRPVSGYDRTDRFVPARQRAGFPHSLSVRLLRPAVENPTPCAPDYGRVVRRRTSGHLRGPLTSPAS